MSENDAILAELNSLGGEPQQHADDPILSQLSTLSDTQPIEYTPGADKRKWITGEQETRTPPESHKSFHLGASMSALPAIEKAVEPALEGMGAVGEGLHSAMDFLSHPALKETIDSFEQRGLKRGAENIAEQAGKGLYTGSGRVTDALFGARNPYTGEEIKPAGKAGEEIAYKGKPESAISRVASDATPALMTAPFQGTVRGGAALNAGSGALMGGATSGGIDYLEQQRAHPGKIDIGQVAKAAGQGAAIGAPMGLGAGGVMMSKLKGEQAALQANLMKLQQAKTDHFASALPPEVFQQVQQTAAQAKQAEMQQIEQMIAQGHAQQQLQGRVGVDRVAMKHGVKEPMGPPPPQGPQIGPMDRMRQAHANSPVAQQNLQIQQLKGTARGIYENRVQHLSSMEHNPYEPGGQTLHDPTMEMKRHEQAKIQQQAQSSPQLPQQQGVGQRQNHPQQENQPHSPAPNVGPGNSQEGPRLQGVVSQSHNPAHTPAFVRNTQHMQQGASEPMERAQARQTVREHFGREDPEAARKGFKIPHERSDPSFVDDVKLNRDEHGVLEVFAKDLTSGDGSEHAKEAVKTWMENYNEHRAFLKSTLGVNVGSHEIMAALHATWLHIKNKTSGVTSEFINRFMGRQLTRDIVHRYADPEFAAKYDLNIHHRLQEVSRGLKVPNDTAGKIDFANARHWTDDEIKASVNLDATTKQKLIDRNSLLGEIRKNHLEKIKEIRDGQTGSAVTRAIRSMAGQDRLARALESDIRVNLGGMPGEHSSAFNEINNYIARQGVNMSVVMNPHIAALHAVEAANVVGADAPRKIFKAGQLLATKNKAANAFVDSMAPQGTFKQLHVESSNPLSNWMDKKVAQLPGMNSKPVQIAGRIASNQVTEDAKMALYATTAGLKAAEEMGFHDGEQFLRKYADGSLTDAQKVEANLRIWNHMDNWIGGAPGGYRQLDAYGRAGTLPGIGGIIRALQPFKHMKVIQLGVYQNAVKRLGQAVAEKNPKAVLRETRVIGMTAGLLVLVGGRYAVPPEIREFFHGEGMEDFQHHLDVLAHVGNALRMKEQHMSPVLFPMAHDMTSGGEYAHLMKAAGDLANPQKRIDQKMMASLTLAAFAGIGSNSAVSIPQLFAKGKKLNQLFTQGGIDAWGAQESGYKADVKAVERRLSMESGKAVGKKDGIYAHATIPYGVVEGIITALGATGGKHDKEIEWQRAVAGEHEAQEEFTAKYGITATKAAKKDWQSERPAHNYLYAQSQLDEKNPNKKQQTDTEIKAALLDSYYEDLHDYTDDRGDAHHSATFWQTQLKHPDEKYTAMQERADHKKAARDARHQARMENVSYQP